MNIIILHISLLCMLSNITLLQADQNFSSFYTQSLDDHYNGNLYTNSSSFEQLFKQANKLAQEKKFDEAITHYQRALSLNPFHAYAYFNLGITWVAKGNSDNAKAALEKAINYDSSLAKAYVYLGIISQQNGLIDEAIAYHQEALSRNPSLTQAYSELARIWNNQRQYDRTILLLKEGLHTTPNSPTLLFELANTYNMVNKYEDAIALYKQLLGMQVKKRPIWYNMAYTYKKIGHLEEAHKCYDEALAIDPGHAESHFGKGLGYLLNGDFEKGWKGYEWRWKKPDQGSYRTYSLPRWDGSDLNGKTILLHTEQGLGDTFQFIRYARLAKDRGGLVIALVQEPLVSILSLCPYIDQVIALNKQLPPFDVHAPLLSLPYILKTTIDTIPLAIPYLYTDKNLINHWKNILSKDTTFKIGICWQGNSKYRSPQLKEVVAAKSIPLDKIALLDAIPGVSLYSLQHMTGTDQLHTLPSQCIIHTFDDLDREHGRFMDTAAIMKNVDLVITVDTSIGHLAGGLGVPVWILLPNPPDWRWMLTRSDSPWYPQTMKLFRQEKPGDWDSIISAVISELKKLVKNKIKTNNQKTIREKEKPKNTVSEPWVDIIDKLSLLTSMIQNEKDENIKQQLREEYQQYKKNTQDLPASITLFQLHQELDLINNQLLHVSKKITTQDSKHIFDTLWISSIKHFCILQSLKQEVKQKMHSLIHSCYS